MNRLKLASLVLAWLLAAPAFAGTVYLPHVPSLEIGDVEYRSWVWVSNNNPDILNQVEIYVISAFQDGTEREEGYEPRMEWIGRGQTRVFKMRGEAGLMEIVAPPDVFIQARLVPVGEDPASGQGIDLPVVSSNRVVPEGVEAQILGLERRDDGSATSSSFGLINLGHQATTCLVDVWTGPGELVVEDVELTFNALSLSQFHNVLAILGQTEGSDWRFGVTCDQPFFPYLLLSHSKTGRAAFFGPAENGSSTLSRPTGGGVSDEFIYLTDLPIDRWGGIELRPFVDSTGINFHGGSGNTVVGGFAQIKINGTTYERGVSFYGRWSQTPFVEFKLDGKYALFTAVVRLDDYARGRYEWAVVEGGRWRRLQRPSDGFRGRERTNPIRVGGAANFSVKGDGVTLFQSGEVYAHRDAVVIEIDVTGVQTLRLQSNHAGHEVLDAPYRNGLSSARLVSNCPWWDLISFADTKLFLAK